MARTVRIALAQINLLVGDVEGNTQKIIAIANKTRANLMADVVVFPELAITGYPPEDLLYRDELYVQIESALARIQSEVTGVLVVVGHPSKAVLQEQLDCNNHEEEIEPGLFYNTATVIGHGQRVATYHKQQLPNYRVFDEKRYFNSGKKACVIDVNGIKIALTICEDLWRSTPTRMAKEAGAECMLTLNASPFYLGKSQERASIIKARAIEAGFPIFYLNLVGGQDELIFAGNSLVVDGSGYLLDAMPHCLEAVRVYELSPSSISVGETLTHSELAKAGWQKHLSQDKKRLTQNSPFAEEVRVCQNAYTWLKDDQERFHFEEQKCHSVLVMGIQDYVRKNGFKGAVIGVSGGIDSALTLSLAVDALGSDAVEAVMMPTRYTSELSLHDAKALAKALNVNYHIIPIEPIFSAFKEALTEQFKGYPEDITEQNLQARTRGMILMALSNKHGRLVLTTGNKSELAVGYATLYGDMAGGFCVLKDVTKGWVYRLARYRNGISPIIPEATITRPPSAELAEDQLDEHSLPPYDLLDQILNYYVVENLGLQDIVDKGFALETVQDVIDRIQKNEYKRFQAPPGPRLTHRAFGKDWRYPLTSGFDSHYSG